MQPPLQKRELLVSTPSSVTLGLGDMARARLREELSPTLREGAALEAPLDSTSGAQRVLITSGDSPIRSDATPGNVAKARAGFVSERPEGAPNQADGTPALLGGAKEKVTVFSRREGGELWPECPLGTMMPRGMEAGTGGGGS